MPERERGRPRPGNGPDNHTHDAILTEGSDTAREMDARRRWERHWSRMPADGWRIALATAAVDNIDRVPSPFDISFAQARAMAAIHGSYCDCHSAPPVRLRGAA